MVEKQEIIYVLRPLAEAADTFENRIPGLFTDDGTLLWVQSGISAKSISLGQARAARSLLQRLEAEGPQDAGDSPSYKKGAGNCEHNRAVDAELHGRLCDENGALYNQEGGDAAASGLGTRPHVAPPASGDVSGRASAGDWLWPQVTKTVAYQGWRLKADHAFTLAYEDGRSAGIREGLERAAKEVERSGHILRPNELAATVRSLINEAKP